MGPCFGGLTPSFYPVMLAGCFQHTVSVSRQHAAGALNRSGALHHHHLPCHGCRRYADLAYPFQTAHARCKRENHSGLASPSIAAHPRSVRHRGSRIHSPARSKRQFSASKRQFPSIYRRASSLPAPGDRHLGFTTVVCARRPHDVPVPAQASPETSPTPVEVLRRFQSLMNSNRR